MVSRNKKGAFLLALYIFGATCVYAPPAHSLAFLEVTALLVDLAKKIFKDSDNEETDTTGIMEQLNEKTMRGTGDSTESMKLFKDIVGDMSEVATAAARGQYNASDYSADGILDALTGQLSDLTRDYNAIEKAMNDAIEAEEKAKLDKKVEMQKQMTILQSQRAALDSLIAQDPTPEREAQRDALDKAIADLMQQIQQNDEKDVRNTEKVQKQRAKLQALQKQIESTTAQFSEQNMQDKMQTELLKLFDTDTKAEEKEMYETAISKLFLKEDEVANPENIRRVVTERRKEYYDAVKNALEAVVTTHVSIKDTNERSRVCTDQSVKTAQSTFGSMGLRQCVELENAIASVGYLDILLAMIQLDTTAEMQKWDNKYELRDYDKDITKFNLDDYRMKKEDLLVSQKQKAKNAIKSKASSKVQSFF